MHAPVLSRRRALLLLALVGCAQPSLEEKAARALAEERPHLAGLLLGKAERQAPLSAQALVVRAHATAAEKGVHAALAAVEAALEAGVPPAELLDAEALAPLAADPAVQRAIARQRGEVSAAAPFPMAPPEAVDAEALEALVAAAERSHSSALIVLREGALVGEWYFGHPRERIEAMSATKSVVSLAVGILIGDGRLTLDTPVAALFPEWRGTPKEAITVRHLLSHTSGLQARRTTEDIYRQDDFVRYALEAPLRDPPGTVFAYNNKATNLIAGVVERAAGEPIDELLFRRLFRPLGITEVTWSRDAAGNRHGMSGMQIHPADFARLGQLILEGGAWNGEQLLPPSFLSLLDTPSQPFDATCGLLWWLKPRAEVFRLHAPFFAALRAEGVAETTLAKLERYAGTALPAERFRHILQNELRRFESRQVLAAARRQKVSPLSEVSGGTFAITAQGYLGNYLLIAPKERLVVVRMSAWQRGVDSTAQSFPEFFALARRLVEPGWDPIEREEERADGF